MNLNYFGFQKMKAYKDFLLQHKNEYILDKRLKKRDVSSFSYLTKKDISQSECIRLGIIGLNDFTSNFGIDKIKEKDLIELIDIMLSQL